MKVMNNFEQCTSVAAWVRHMAPHYVMYSAGITARSMLHVSTKFDNLTLGLDVAGDLTAAAAAGAAILISRSSVVMETDTNLYPMSKSS